MHHVEVLEPVDIELDDPEDVFLCTASYHPAHQQCGKPAAYVIVAKCPLCELRLRYLCPPHCADFLPAYLRNGPWCGCGPSHQAPHEIVEVRVRGL